MKIFVKKMSKIWYFWKLLSKNVQNMVFLKIIFVKKNVQNIVFLKIFVKKKCPKYGTFENFCQTKVQKLIWCFWKFLSIKVQNSWRYCRYLHEFVMYFSFCWCVGTFLCGHSSTLARNMVLRARKLKKRCSFFIYDYPRIFCICVRNPSIICGILR